MERRKGDGGAGMLLQMRGQKQVNSSVLLLATPYLVSFSFTYYMTN